MKHSSSPALLLAAIVSLTAALSHAAPTINTPPSSITPQYGTTGVLSATVTAEPGASHVWMRDGTTQIINGGRYSGADTATLTITGVNSADNGSYVLTVTDGTGSTPATAATINVTQTPGSLDPAYAGAGANGGSTLIYTNNVLHLPDGRTLIAARNQFNGVTSPLTTATSNLVVMAANGTVSHPAGSTFNGEVTCLFRMDDGKILVGGDFTTHTVTIGNINTTRTRVARLNADLSLDTSFVPTGPAAKPSLIFADSYGRVYLGGGFASYDGLLGFQYLVRLNSNGSLDQSFKPVLNGGVNVVALQKDGKFIIGGFFDGYNGVSSGSIPRLLRFNADGSIDTGYTPTLPGTSTVQNGLALDDADNLYVARSDPNVSITKLLPDGTAVPGFNFALTPEAPLGVLAVQPGGKLAAGGTFTTPSNRLFRVNTSDASPDTSFGITTGITITSGTPEVYGLSSDAIGRLWVTGKTFSTYNGSASNRFAVIQGSAGPQLAFVAHPTGKIADQTGTVTLSGHATGNNGFTHLWHKDGQPLSNGGRFSGVDTGTLTITGLLETDEGGYTLVVSSPGAASITSRVANLEVQGAPEITLDPVAQTVDFGGTVTFTGAAVGAATLAYQWYYGDTALVNGTGVSGATSPSLTLTNVDFNDAGQYSLKVTNGLGEDTSATVALTIQKRPGGIAGGANPLPMFNGEVNAIALLPDGSYVVGGGFQTISMNSGANFTSRSAIARILANGTLDTSFPTAATSVHCIAFDPVKNHIFIGGTFSTVTSGGSPTNRIRVARLMASGGSYVLDTAFDTSSAGPDDIVHSLAPVGDGSVYIAGSFEKVGNTADSFKGDDYTARLGANGARATSYTSGASNTTYTLLRNSSGSLYVGGTSNLWNETTLFPGTPFRRLVLVSASGSRTASFVPPGTFPSYPIVHSLLRLADGSLLAGCNNPLNPYVLKLNATTGASSTFTTNHTITVNALAQQPDGKVLIGSELGNFTRNSPVDGTLDASFDIGTGFNSAVNDIKVDSSGRIYIAGNFTLYNGITRNRFVILNGGDLDSRSEPKPGQTITFADIADRAFVPGNAAANTVTITLPTASSGLPVTTVVTSGPATLAGNKLTITGAGTVVLTASQAGNDDFGAASVSQSIEISKAAQTLTFASLIDRPNGSAPFLLTGSLNSGLPVVYEVLSGPASVSGNLLTLSGTPGTVSIRASHPGNSDFDAAESVEQSFEVFTGTVSPLPQTIIFTALSPRAANEPAFSVSATATSGLPVTLAVTTGGNIASISGNVVTLSGLTGSVTITATQPGNLNYLAAKAVTQSFKVSAAATTLTLTNLIQTYTGTPRPIGVIGGTATTISYTVNKVKGTTPPTAAGSYPVEAVSGSGTGAVKKTGTLVINKAPLIVAADDKRKFVGQNNPLLTFAFSGFLGSDHAGNALTKAVTVGTKATKTSPGGNYPITPAGGASSNYTLVYVSGNMKVESWAGQYEALLKTAQGVPVGKLEITVLANSVGFTAKLTSAKGAAVSFKGDFGLNLFDERANAIVNRTVGTGASAINYRLTLDLPLTGDFEAFVTTATGTPAGPYGNFGLTTTGQKLLLSTGKPPVSFAGNYTLMLGRPMLTVEGPELVPQSTGYATIAIDSKGKMTLVGQLADGTKITASLMPDLQSGYRFYVLPYGTRLDSYAAADLNLVAHPDLPGRGYIPTQTRKLWWVKAANSKDANFRDGIPETNSDIRVDAWLPPVTKPTVINMAQRLQLNLESTGNIIIQYSLSGGLTLTGLPENVTLDAAGKLVVPGGTAANPLAWKATVAPATGLITGSHKVVFQTKPYTVNFSGILRQPSSTDPTPEIMGGGFEIVPQLPGQTTGNTPSEMMFINPVFY